MKIELFRFVLHHAGVPIRLTAERFRHIAKRHPEMADQQDRTLEMVTQLDTFKRGTAVR